ncbi:MAG: alpha/beta fold hydrolase [Solirubrobacterales bacterium]
MKRRWKILIGVVVVLAVLLGLNTIALDNQTKGAEVTIEGGEILELEGGEVQIYEDPESDPHPGQVPIVLVHCYGCSLHWWDAMAPELTDAGFRVVRIDLLGHGGSGKPSSGYSIAEQSGLVAQAMNELALEGAVVVGHSMGGSVATSLAESSSELVDRVVIIDQAPDESFGGLDLLAQIQYVPVVGEAIWRFGHAGPWQSSFVKSGYSQAFAPDYELADGFPNPDQVVSDYDSMTYSSFDQAAAAEQDFLEERSLVDRLTAAAVPVLAIFGTEDQLYDDPAEALAAYEQVPGAVTEEIEGAGHSPNVEKPEETGRLIIDFAAEATPPVGAGGGRKRSGAK